jgi:hypothetical protein
MSIIGICGFQGSGKDTAADYFVNNHSKFIKLSFVSAVKDIVSTVFGWERKSLEGDTIESRTFREQIDEWWSVKLGIPSFTPRIALQKIGTDLFRNHLSKDIWLNIIEKKIDTYIKKGYNIVISDCRFPNEFEMLRKYNAFIIHIKRNNYTDEEISKLHESETMWCKEKFDMEIKNTSTIDYLHLSLYETFMYT